MTKLTILALAAAPFAALAGDAPSSESIAVLAVAEPPGPSSDLAEITASLRAALAVRTSGVMGADEIRQRMQGNTSAASLSELDRAYAGAVAASQAGDYEASARTLRAIVEDLERLPEKPDAFAQWSRALLRLARAEGSLGRKGEARDTMERLLRADPTARADPELFPPSFAKQLDEIRTALKNGPKRKLVVGSGGRPARVFVEGREVGQAPLTLALSPGRYRVSGAVGELRVSAGTVDVTQEDQNVTLDFGQAEAFKPDLGPGLAIPAKQRQQGIVTAGAALKLDRVLAASVLADGDVRFLVGSLYDVRRGMLQREGRIRLAGGAAPQGGVAALAGFLMTGEASSMVIAKTDLSPSPTPENPLLPRQVGRSGKSSGLGWTAIGAGALAVGLGAFATYEAVVASQKYSDADKLKSTLVYDFNDYSRLRSDGDSATRTAWVAGGGAGVCALTAGVLGYLSYRQSGEIGPFRF
jgi:tetratricopeptide (TPR) repeat protein